MQIKYQAKVKCVNGATETVQGQTQAKPGRMFYELKCHILLTHFKPNVAIGTDNVDIVDFELIDVDK